MTEYHWQLLWEKVDASGDCWLWTASRTNGYARFTYWIKGGPRRVSVHRAIWERLVGPIPEGMTIDHLCRVRHCVNPDHLEVVTTRRNTLRSPITRAGRNDRKTHCHRGHPFTGGNLHIRASGGRRCRTCARDLMRRYRQRKQDA